ncbi:MAG: hypothetical protein JTT11_03810 [Candidatus Brockarchaeota archaeon]|nr:hypothetical protein [Candidatus Brockarchaeota archaeon]
MIEMLAEQDEDIGMKVVKLEKKTSNLEKSVNEVSNLTRAILTDVRNVLTELDNPMNYLKGLGIDEVMLSMAENITEKKLTEFMERKLEDYTKNIVEGKLKESTDQIIKKFMDEQVGSIIEGKVKEMKEKGVLNVPINPDELKKVMDEKMSSLVSVDEIKELVRKELFPLIEKEVKNDLISSVPRGYGKQAAKDLESVESAAPMRDVEASSVSKANPRISAIGLTACAGALMHMFGRSGAENVVNDYYKREWIDYDLKQSLLDLMGTIQSKDIPNEKEIGVNEHAIAAYLFDKLKSGSDLDFVVILVSLTLPSKFFITK